MLVLRRKVGQTIVLTGPDGTVSRFMIVDVRHGNNVGISFELHPETTVDRLEVHEAKQLKLMEQSHAEVQEDKCRTCRRSPTECVCA